MANQTNEELLSIIRQAMKSKAPEQPQKQMQRINGKGVQHTKLQPTTKEHGKLGDFTRSNSNPPTRTNNTAIIGYEEVPKTHLNRKDERDGTNGKADVVEATTEMVRKAIKLALNQTGGAPSKRAVKHMAAPKMTRPDRVFQSGKGCGPGSSRSVTLGIIKAISAKETGCIVRKENISESVSRKNANTTQGNYNPMIVE
jgi:hypothetical protein